MRSDSVAPELDRHRMRGTRPGGGGPRAKTSAGGRICAGNGCDTVLSTYNHSPFCWLHEPRHEFTSAVRSRGPRPSEVEILDLLTRMPQAS
ncbi:MAG TPA: hypothetical protein VIC58_04600 [Actinomycetota bacterium]|jgi:hypothetical protein